MGNQEKGKSRASSQTTLHQHTSMRPARRRCSWSFAKKTEDPRMKECVENFQCRCTARGPQQETHRRVTPTHPATADSVWLVGTRAFLGHQERDNVVMVRGDDLVSSADIEDLCWLESMLKEKFKITTDIIGSNSGC